ncbi:SH3 domain-containing protein [Clostridium sp. LY3-2]|uniref:GH25 family lysozyme n=1 Tax=Clostridium sp. LY3-2 TaxID=2942482 RepID=UPI0021522617|nr:GH25 family lysozyme [Clostridium sp. LY3-2]MCR6515793.1 SH3 domain-containing protein [Clostridium sp. LY3-2]
MLKGIDVSEHQGRVDWEKVKDNVDFVMLRAGYGKNNIDKQFIRNIKECNRLGIKVGVYWFSYAYTVEMARQEAKYCLAAIKDYKVEYPVCFDLEYDTRNYAEKNGVTLTKRLATDMVKAFCNEVESQKYWAMNYANPDFINNQFYQNELDRYSLWIAWYGATESNAKKYGCEMWQYTEDGTIKGIGTNSVDVNYDYRNFAKAIRDKGLNNLGQSSSNNDAKYDKEYSEHGVCTVAVDKLNIRNKPSLDGKVEGSYTRGESVSYDYVIDNDGYRWIRWIGASSGKYRYMAVRDLKTNKRLGYCK